MSGVLKGHMARAWREIRRYLGQMDGIIEVADARAPATSRSPQLARWLAGRSHVLVLARADLADPAATRRWRRFWAAAGVDAVPLGADGEEGLELLRRRLASFAAGPLGKPRVMVVGLPNVGKSTLLNRLAGRRRVRTGPEPGVTRGRQWVDLGSCWLLDTPGVLPPRLGQGRRRLILAALGLVDAGAVDPYHIAGFLLDQLGDRAPFRRALARQWGVDPERALREGAPAPLEAVLDAVARRRGLLRSGGVPDWERAAVVLVAAFRSGDLGRWTLESPEETHSGPGEGEELPSPQADLDAPRDSSAPE